MRIFSHRHILVMEVSSSERSALRVGGMLVGYYLICPRKAWLSMRDLWMEQESQAVALGRLVGASSYARRTKELLLTAEAPDGTPLVGKVDWAQLDAGVLHETKKGRSCEDAHRWQLRFYLWLLSLNSVTGPEWQAATRHNQLPAASPHRAGSPSPRAREAPR